MLDKKLIKKVLDTALQSSADFAEVFVEEKFTTDTSLLSSKIEKVNNAKSRMINFE